MDSIRLKARAKINLGLDVLGKREDGYHEVRMVMQTIGIYDRLILTKIPEEEIRITSNLAFLPVNENNLIYKAIKLLKDEYHFPGGISVDLNKFIPVAAGRQYGCGIDDVWCEQAVWTESFYGKDDGTGSALRRRCSVLCHEGNGTGRRHRRKAYTNHTCTAYVDFNCKTAD